MEVKLRMLRYNPEVDDEPHYQTFLVEAEPNDRVLDLMHYVKAHQDPTLAYRSSCEHGICGSDAVRINGVNMLACKALVRQLGEDITVEPILGLPIIKDLIVDMEPFWDHYRSIMPYLVNDEIPEKGERVQTQQARARFDDTTKCILCAACTTSCPSFWADGEYVGPAAIVQAHRFIFDDRDTAAAERLSILNEQFGVWRCRTIFNCTTACPKEIKVTKAIAEVKKAINSGRLD
jgi:succinate dehydrogenase / fumarate reductase iron-sulfur subunit